MTQLALNEDTASLQQALNEIYFYRGIIPVKAYEILSCHQEKTIPTLIQALENVIQRHDRIGDYYVAYIHALLLLSQFREKKAYPTFIKLLNLPFDSIDHLLGDMCEIIPQMIMSVYNGDPEPLFALFFTRESDFVLRLLIGDCFSALIYHKMIEKEMVLLRFQEVIASGKVNDDQDFFTSLANMTMESKLEPLYDTIRAAFKTVMLNNDFMGIQDFEEGLLEPIEKIIRDKNLNPLTDGAKTLARWYDSNTPIIPKIERNSTCPCGSGHKFKKCCIRHL